MNRWGKYVAIAIWMFLFSYLGDVFEIPKNIYYILIGFPLLLGGGLLIFYLFEKGNTNKR
jgi:hypothetical protein